MIKFEKTVTPSPEQWEAIIRGMRNPKNSWARSDSVNCLEEDSCENCPCNNSGECISHLTDPFVIGHNDHTLMMNLANGGPVHAKYRRMIPVYVDITAPLYWWKEFDTYKIGTVTNSCSTMHKIHDKEFTLEDFSVERLEPLAHGVMKNTAETLEYYRKQYNRARNGDTEYDKADAKACWENMIQLLPSSYNQKRTVQMNYEVLVGIYKWRKNHKLQEWRGMCDWIETLPYSELITAKEEKPETSFEEDMMAILNDMTNAQAEWAIEYLKGRYLKEGETT